MDKDTRIRELERLVEAAGERLAWINAAMGSLQGHGLYPPGSMGREDIDARRSRAAVTSAS